MRGFLLLVLLCTVALGSDGERRIVSQDPPRRNINDFPPIMDTAMVAEFLGLNVQIVRKYARDGVIPAYRPEGTRPLHFFRDEVVAWLRASPVTPEDAKAE